MIVLLVPFSLNYTDDPFQIQIEYTKSNGEKWLRVVTSSKGLTLSRDTAEESVNTTPICLTAIQNSARLAQIGNYTDARINLVSVQRLLQRTMKTSQNQKDYLSFIVQAEKLDQFMRETQQQDKVFGATGGAKRDDSASKAMYQMKNVSVEAFHSHK